MYDLENAADQEKPAEKYLSCDGCYQGKRHGGDAEDNEQDALEVESTLVGTPLSDV